MSAWGVCDEHRDEAYPEGCPGCEAALRAENDRLRRLTDFVGKIIESDMGAGDDEGAGKFRAIAAAYAAWRQP